MFLLRSSAKQVAKLLQHIFWKSLFFKGQKKSCKTLRVLRKLRSLSPCLRSSVSRHGSLLCLFCRFTSLHCALPGFAELIDFNGLLSLASTHSVQFSRKKSTGCPLFCSPAGRCGLRGLCLFASASLWLLNRFPCFCSASLRVFVMRKIYKNHCVQLHT